MSTAEMKTNTRCGCFQHSVPWKVFFTAAHWLWQNLLSEGITITEIQQTFAHQTLKMDGKSVCAWHIQQLSSKYCENAQQEQRRKIESVCECAQKILSRDSQCVSVPWRYVYEIFRVLVRLADTFTKAGSPHAFIWNCALKKCGTRRRQVCWCAKQS